MDLVNYIYFYLTKKTIPHQQDHNTVQDMDALEPVQLLFDY